MQKISAHVPDELNLWISLAAKAKRQDKSEIIREALGKGLRTIYPKNQSALALLELAKMAQKLPSEKKPIRDLSINHDYYLWGGKKRKQNE